MSHTEHDRDGKMPAAPNPETDLAALIDAQLDEIVCGGWSRTIFDKINPN